MFKRKLVSGEVRAAILWIVRIRISIGKEGGLISRGAENGKVRRLDPPHYYRIVIVLYSNECV